MAKTKDIIAAIETIAPLETQEEWDNSGWQINLHSTRTNKVLVALTVTEDVVDQAIEQGCDMIVSHHPLIFSALKCIKNRTIIKAIQNNIQVYSAHTNFDQAENGTTTLLIEKICSNLNMVECADINNFTKIVTLETSITASELANHLKTVLNLTTLRSANFQANKEIKKIALCAGSGASFIREAKIAGADCFITGDVKYHDVLDCGMLTFDVGHFESEIISIETLKNIIEKQGIEVVTAKEEPVFEVI